MSASSRPGVDVETESQMKAADVIRLALLSALLSKLTFPVADVSSARNLKLRGILRYCGMSEAVIPLRRVCCVNNAAPFS